MRQLAKWLIWVAMASVVAGFAWVYISDSSELNRLDLSIAEQETNIVSRRVELRELRREAQAFGEGLKALPDSVRMAQMGIATKKGFEIAKQEAAVEGLITRSRAKIRSLEAARDTLSNQRKRRTAPVLFLLSVLLAAYFLLRRRAG
ncbi:MAG: hypothetical protein OEN01_13365 [Candidatus Krumholzibacteria bacterium]|nr:hypothetical protein [Candidatus Krumholzibacteria bacterium]